MSSRSRRSLTRPTLFARMGWAVRYDGSEQPIGGGKYNEDNKGGESANFRRHGKYLYGFCDTHQGAALNLSRIDPACRSGCIDECRIVWVSRRHKKDGQFGLGQVIVGWYNIAELHKFAKEWPIRGKDHCQSRCMVENAVLLPPHERTFSIPANVKDGMGRTQTRYMHDNRGALAVPDWAWKAQKLIESYVGENLLDDSHPGYTLSVQRDIERTGQGAGLSPAERKVVEDRAIDKVTEHYESRGWLVEGWPQSSEPYDLLCTKGRTKLHVEVKGTTGAGHQVILTRNEVHHANDPKVTSVLAVVSNIKISLRGKKPRANGGDLYIERPFRPTEASLNPICYDYTVEGKK